MRSIFFTAPIRVPKNHSRDDVGCVFRCAFFEMKFFRLHANVGHAQVREHLNLHCMLGFVHITVTVPEAFNQTRGRHGTNREIHDHCVRSREHRQHVLGVLKFHQGPRRYSAFNNKQKNQKKRKMGSAPLTLSSALNLSIHNKQQSVYESCRFLNFSFSSFITPQCMYRFCL